MSEKELADKKIMAYDTLCILPYPITGGEAPYVNPEYDSHMRIVYFIPGRENKYFEKG
jgi:hypothetical protein